jgi:hypothetical protein
MMKSMQNAIQPVNGLSVTQLTASFPNHFQAENVPPAPSCINNMQYGGSHGSAQGWLQHSGTTSMLVLSAFTYLRIQFFQAGTFYALHKSKTNITHGADQHSNEEATKPAGIAPSGFSVQKEFVLWQKHAT